MTHGRLIGAALCIVLAGGALAAQTLGEVARKEEARRKELKTPAKVYTNDTLRSDSGGAATSTESPVGRTPAPPAAANPSPAPPAPPSQPDETKTEAYWKRRMQAERDGLSRAQIFAEALQSRINALTTDFAARADPAQRNVIAADRQKALAELDRVKKEIQDHQKAITDIQEEARRAGVPAGWVR